MRPGVRDEGSQAGEVDQDSKGSGMGVAPPVVAAGWEDWVAEGRSRESG